MEDATQMTFEGIIQLATSGGFAALAWWLLAIRMPRDQDKFMDALKTQREDFEKSVSVERDHARELLSYITREFVDALRKVERQAVVKDE